MVFVALNERLVSMLNECLVSSGDPVHAKDQGTDVTPPPDSDLNAKATIRNAALRLFAERGVNGVSMREIATEAGVSPALIVHHFGSKIGLRQAIDAHVVSSFEESADRIMTDDTGVRVASDPDGDAFDEATEAAFGEWQQVADPITLAYIRRLLLSNEPAGTEILARWHMLSVRALESWAEAGAVNPGDDLALRAAVLMVHDLGLLLLQDHIDQLFGDSLANKETMKRWSAEAARLYQGDLFALPEIPSSGPASTEAPTREEADTDG